jgi:hypothetical protein
MHMGLVHVNHASGHFIVLTKSFALIPKRGFVMEIKKLINNS